MALWNDQSGREKNVPEPAAKAPEKVAVLSPVGDPPPRPAVTQNRADAPAKESVISAGLIIEGKIEGSGHVRIAGEFKGDVNVRGNLTIEAGAHLTGGVKADTVIVGGQLDGNIDAASRVELLSDRRAQRRAEGGLPHRGGGFTHARQGGIRLGREAQALTRA